MFTCAVVTLLVCLCRAELGDPHSYQPLPKSCVQAVSNKLLNLIKRLGIILHSPQAPWSSAIMNTFGLIIIPGFQSPLQGKPSGNQVVSWG